MQCSLTKLYTNDPTDPACLVRVLLGAIDSHEASTATYMGFPIGFPHRLLGHLSALMLAGGECNVQARARGGRCRREESRSG